MGGIERSLSAFAWVMLVGALLSAWLALCQWQQLDYLGFALADLPIDARPFANFNQPNLLATLLVLGLLAVALLYGTERFGPAIALLIVALLGFGLAMTQARAALLELLMVSALLLAKRYRLSRRLGWRHVVAGLLMIGIAAACWQAARGVAPAAPGARGGAEMLQLGARGPHWWAMLDALRLRPWLGYGWSQGAAAQFAVSPDHPAAPGVFDYGHNLVLDLLIWNGLALGAAIVAGLTLWLWTAARGARDGSSVLALACVVAVFAHAMVEYPLYFAYFLLPAGVLMGGLCATTMPRATIPVSRWLSALVLGSTCATLLLVCADYLKLEDDVRSLRYEHARIGIDRAPHELSTPVLLTHMGAFTRFARTAERKGMSERELQAMAAVVMRFPSGPNIVRYAAALSINGQPEAASDALRRVCKMNRLPTCESMKKLWIGLGEREPAIALVSWPP